MPRSDCKKLAKCGRESQYHCRMYCKGMGWVPNCSKKERPKCVGCGKTDKECGEYGTDNPVEEDGTFKDNKFVCPNCYVKLVP